MKMQLVGIVPSDEDSRKPYALQIKFPMGIITQPLSIQDLFIQFKQIIDDSVKNELPIMIDIVIIR